MAKKLGSKVRELRASKRLTLDGLAVLAGMSKSYLWEIENRDAPRPSAEKLDALARALGVTSQYFLDEDAREPAEQHLDEAFFRNYQQLDSPAKEQLRKIMETFKRS